MPRTHAGGDAGRAPDIAIAHKDLVWLELHLGIAREKLPRTHPMGGGAPAVEQARFRKDDPEQMLATRAPPLATARTNCSVHVFRAAASTPSPPAMMSVVMAAGGPNFR